MNLLKLTCILFLGCTAIQKLVADPLVPNGGFESGTTGWGMWTPDESSDKGCRFDVVSDAPHSGTHCARLQSDAFARFCIGSAMVPVHPGEHYSVSVWVRAAPGAQARKDQAGFAVRLFLRQGNGDAEGGHLFIGLGNRVVRTAPPDPASPKLPTKWTQVKAVIEIPPGVDGMGPSLFSWWTKGALFADDFTIEKVDPSTPVTPLWQRPATASRKSAPVSAGETAPIIISDDALLAALNLDAPGMEKVKAAAQTSGTHVDWPAVESAYLDFRRTASTARWGIMPADKPAHPKEKDDPAGDQVLLHHIRNDYHFPMAAVVDMGKDFNWTYDPVPRNSPAYSDEWTYGPIGRMEFWQTLASAYWLTGNEKYATGWVDYLKDFAAKNPMHFDPVPGVPTLWRSLDSAIRISSQSRATNSRPR